MTFLSLVNTLKRECSVSGATLTTLVGVSGEMLRLTEWVQQAHASIQSQYVDWAFLWGTGTLTITSGSQTVAKPTTVNKWHRNRFRIGDTPLAVIDYYDWETVTSPATGMPSTLIVMPNGSLKTDTIPDTNYTLTYDYWAYPLVLIADGDNPLIPAHLQMVIIGDAMMRYANYEAAAEIYNQGQAIYTEYSRKLMADQTRNSQMAYELNHADILITCE